MAFGSSRYETLNGYVVRLTTERAVGIEKARSSLTAVPEPVVWLPRAVCQDGDVLAAGDTDICVFASIADERGLDY